MKLPRVVLDEAIAALATRCRWYEARDIAPPANTLYALRALCSVAGVDPTKVGS